MPLDHSKAAVTIYFDGIMLTCLNEDVGRFEIGVVKHPEHFFSLDILEVGPTTIKVVNHLLQYDQPLHIELAGSAPQAVSLHVTDEPFERDDPEMDAEDFRWITDLGTDEFHGAAALELISPDSEEAMGVSLQPLIYIKAGIFYAMQKSEKEFNKENFGKGTDPERLGHIADTMAADIFFDAADSQLIIRNGGDNPPPQVVLTNTPETKYYISLKNIRHRQSTDDVAGSIHAMAAMAPPPPQVGSDFRHYYLVIKDPQGNKFDLSFADGAPKVPQNCDSTHVSSLPNLDPPA